MDGAVLDCPLVGVGGCCADCVEEVEDDEVLLGRASKSDMIIGRPTKSFMRMWVVAMVLFFTAV
jgi:hypothetical protein